MLLPIYRYLIMAAGGHFEFWKFVFLPYQLNPCVRLNKFHQCKTCLLIRSKYSWIYDTLCMKDFAYW
jgi:hypothetical protein